MKPANKVKQNNTAEPVERRVSTERNSYTPPEAETQCLAEPEEGLARIRAAARKDGTLRFNNLLHHITVERLWKAYDGLKKRAVAGVDGVTWYQYGENLLPNLIELHKRIQTDRYQAQPVKRGWISKGDGSKRPLGITCVEDKIVQQAVVWILEQIVEQDFLGFSYGSRPERGQHHALDAVYMAISVKKVSYVLDADIKGYYDHIDQPWLIRLLEHRIADRRILKLIEQTVQAGIVEDGRWRRSDQGIPQGALCKALHNAPYA